MRHRLSEITAFVHVVETGSVSAAASRLGLAKSIVSERVKRLEDMLGVRLLDRSTRRVVPTDAGLTFYDRTRPLLLELDDAVEEVSDRTGTDLVGPLRITAPMSFGTMYLGPILFELVARHPRLELALELDDRMLDLASQGFDLAVRIGPLRDSTLVARKVAVSRRVVCCSPEYLRRRGRPQAIDDLRNHECVGYIHRAARHLWRFEPARVGGAVRTVAVQCRVGANNGEAMRDAAVVGLGLAILPLFIVADALRNGALVNALPDAHPVADPISVVYPQHRHMSRRVRAVIDHVSTRLRGQPPWERGVAPPVRIARTSGSPDRA